MKQELERELVDNYPDLYQWYDRDPDSTDGPVASLTTYGFQHGDGWYSLLETLSETLTRLEVEMEAVQCKEKFGGLRFYHDGIRADDEKYSYMAMGAIRHAEQMSFHICEECGAAAECRDSGYLRTLCEDCWSEEQSRRRERNFRNMDNGSK